MSPVAQLSLLALASTVLAVPRAQPMHGHQHAHFHAPSGYSWSASGTAAYSGTKPALGATGTSTGTGFHRGTAVSSVGPGGYDAQTIKTTVTLNAADSSSAPIAAAGYVSGADTDDCSDVTVTSTSKTTVYVTATSNLGSDVSAVVEETTTSGGKTLTLKSTIFRTVRSTVYVTPSASAPVSALSASSPSGTKPVGSVIVSSKPISSVVPSSSALGSSPAAPVMQSSPSSSSAPASPVSQSSASPSSSVVSSSASSSSAASSTLPSPSSSSHSSSSASKPSSTSTSTSSSSSSSSPAAHTPPAYTPPTTSSAPAAPTTPTASSSSAVPTTPSSTVVPTTSSPSSAPAYTAPALTTTTAPSSSVAPTTSSTWQAAANAVASSSSSSSSGTGKRGLAYNDASLTDMFSGSSSISWAYNWGSSTSGLASGLNYIPLLWGLKDDFTGSWATHAASAISSGSTHIFSFNEPDLSSQANLSPQAAADAWKIFMQPLAGKAKLCAPAVTNGGGAMGLTWLSNFLSACSGCTIDCVNIHWYDSAENPDYFKSHVTNATSISGGKPVFVSEFGASGSDAQVSSFLKEVMPWMDGNDGVAGYAYFMVAQGMLVNGNAPSSYGATYKSYTG